MFRRCIVLTYMARWPASSQPDGRSQAVGKYGAAARMSLTADAARGEGRRRIMSTQSGDQLPLILVAHHSCDTVELLRAMLEPEGFTTLCAYNGRTAQLLARRHQPSLLLLDQALPLLDGLDLCRELRRAGSEAAIFILSDRTGELNTLLAFGAEADDYVPLPVHPRELIGRMKAALRRAGAGASRPSDTLRCGQIELNSERREALAGGKALALTSLEYELLATFVSHPGRVFSREELLGRLTGFLRGEPFDRAVDIHVSNLRRKLRATLGDAAPLETVRGVGYRLRATATAEPESPAAQEGMPPALGRLALAALERAPVPLLVLSPDRTVLLYNEAAEHLCGWKAGEVTGQVTCYSLLGCHSEDGALLCHGRCVLRPGAPDGASDQQARYVITRKDGRELAVDANYSRLDGVDGEGVCTLLTLQPRN